ncbi:hypothetical protein B9Z55_007290 [Caenorhabditis nigoni]|uniref:Uncharacterized protein n=1 Tax=Caenorhabditis nigoni TaxID=1611254 RepID=A0A2G5V913_9PELO|nr:hypothetical protein B9Z55_007290 [Caenorhabditis nigoni]
MVKENDIPDVEPETALKIVRAEIKDLQRKLAIMKEEKLETEQKIQNLREEMQKAGKLTLNPIISIAGQEISSKQKIADVSAEIIEQLRKKLAFQDTIVVPSAEFHMAAPPPNQDGQEMVPMVELQKAYDKIGILRNDKTSYERELWSNRHEINGLKAQRVIDNQLNATRELFAARNEIQQLFLDGMSNYQSTFHDDYLGYQLFYLVSGELDALKAKNAELEEQLARAGR